MVPRGFTDARERIVEAASALFFNQGYHATTIDQVIEQSGVSRPTVYSHFKTKEDLCLAYLSSRKKLDTERLRNAIAKEKTGKGKFMAVVKTVSQYMQQTCFRGCGYFNMISEFPDGDHPIVKEARLYVDNFREIIRDGVKELKASDSKYSKMDLKRMTDTYYLIVCGAIMASQEYRDKWPFERAAKEIEGLTKI
ncbi:MAG: TetR/AcrR family transcriptional regulator [Nitrospinota bacterium]